MMLKYCREFFTYGTPHFTKCPSNKNSSYFIAIHTREEGEGVSKKRKEKEKP